MARRLIGIRRLLFTVVLAVVLALSLAACRGPDQVKWVTYDTTLQPRIDVASVQGDCAELAVLRRYADATSDIHEKATGVNNEALVGYIQAAERRAGCPSS